MFSSLAPARRRLALALVALGVVAVVAGLVAAIVNTGKAVPGASGSARSSGPAGSTGSAGSPGSPGSPGVRGSADGSTRTAPAVRRPGPVLLVPGYGGSTSGLAVLATTLRRKGRDATVVRLPGDSTGDLAAQARVLAGAARAALARTGATSVDVVGYSAGGVVARLWAKNDGGATLARRIVTLGSPHHGTDVATLAAALAPDSCPLACQQLEVNSPLLRRLNTGDETPVGPQWVAIRTTKDQVVTPVASARLRGALNVVVQAVCPGSTVGHGGLPSDPQVQSMVLAELSAADVRPLTRADCGRPAA